LSDDNTDVTHQLQQTNTQLRDEQQRRKQHETQLNELQETNAEVTAAKDAAETVTATINVISYSYAAYVLTMSALVIVIVSGIQLLR